MKDGTLLTPVVSYRQVSSRLRRLHAAWVAAGSPDAWRFWYQDQHERLPLRPCRHSVGGPRILGT